MDIAKIYRDTVKFTSQFEHNVQDVLRMLTEDLEKRGINLTNRGKYAEVKCYNQNYCFNSMWDF